MCLIKTPYLKQCERIEAFAGVVFLLLSEKTLAFFAGIFGHFSTTDRGNARAIG